MTTAEIIDIILDVAPDTRAIDAAKIAAALVAAGACVAPF